MSDEIKVVALKEVEGALADMKSAINKDIVDLKEQMEADKAATDLALDERKDDAAKYLAAIDDITKKTEKFDKALADLNQKAEYGETGVELTKGIESIAKGVFYESNSNPDGKDIKRERPGKLTLKQLVDGVIDEQGRERTVKHVEVNRLKEMNDNLLLLDAIMRRGDDAESYKQAGGIRSTDLYKAFMRQAEYVAKATSQALDTTDMANWMPTAFSQLTWESIKIGLPEVNVFDEFPMNAGTVQLHNESSDDEADIVAEVTTAAALSVVADTAMQNLDPGKVTFSATKLRSRFAYSVEALEDSIVPLLPRLQAKLVRNMREALADGIINGQETTAVDTGGTHFGKANASLAATDVRGAMDGIRYFAAAPTTDHVSDNAGGDLSLSAMRQARKLMGEKGQDLARLVWFLGISGYMDLLNDTALKTADVFGATAPNRSGALGMVDGVDILLSRRLPENTNGSGIIDGTTADKGVHIIVRTDAYLLGNRRRMTIGQDVYGVRDARDLFLFWRGDFQKMFATNDWTETVLVDVDL